MGYVDTVHYKFKKPEETNKFDVNDTNKALDQIDASLYVVDQYAKENTTRLDKDIKTAQKTANSGVEKADAAQQVADTLNNSKLGKNEKAADSAHADNADKAKKDSNGNTITDTYATKSDLISGLVNIMGYMRDPTGSPFSIPKVKWSRLAPPGQLVSRNVIEATVDAEGYIFGIIYWNNIMMNLGYANYYNTPEFYEVTVGPWIYSSRSVDVSHCLDLPKGSELSVSNDGKYFAISKGIYTVNISPADNQPLRTYMENKASARIESDGTTWTVTLETPVKLYIRTYDDNPYSVIFKIDYTSLRRIA